MIKRKNLYDGVNIKMNKSKTAKKIYNTAHITGKFVLRSGQVSDEYFDKYLFEADPELLMEIAKIMNNLIPADTEVIAGLEMGGIPVVTALSVESGINMWVVADNIRKGAATNTVQIAEILIRDYLK